MTCDLPALKSGQTYRVTGSTGKWRVSIPCKTAYEAHSVVQRYLELTLHGVAVVWLSERGRRTFVRRFSRW